jgi:hypothetical protein
MGSEPRRAVSQTENMRRLWGVYVKLLRLLDGSARRAPTGLYPWHLPYNWWNITEKRQAG